VSQSIPDNKRIQMKSFKFIGKFVKTTNEAEMTGNGVIPAQWESFYKDQTLDTIPSKKNSKIMAIYTDYESDETGSYTFALGTEVTDVDDVPQGMKSYSIPECNYMVFTTRKGPIQEIVVEAWMYIWEWSKTNNRAFLTDFELYDERCADPENSQVDIYISVK
jgi:predicted transcriptional regulator YdeE